MDYMRAMAGRIKEARSARGISQSELARLLDKSKQLISAWEGARSEITIGSLLQLARLLAVSPAWLITGADPGASPLFASAQGTEVAALTANEVVRHAEGELDLRDVQQRAHNPFIVSENSFTFEHQDDSMEPLFVRHDRLTVDPAKPVTPNTPVLALVHAENGIKLPHPIIVVRRIHLLSSSMAMLPCALVPEKPGWPTITVSGNQDARVVGAIAVACRRIT